MLSELYASRAPSYLPPRPLKAAQRALGAMARPATPLLAQVVVIRRCNLACGYCNEYDDHSPPVPVDELHRRVDHLASLGTLIVTLTGGEPLIHPELDAVVQRVVSHGMICTSITNAYPITQRWIDRLNAARLSLLQVSIDNVDPNEVSQKSWSKVRKKLVLLRERATFRVNVNAVLGSCPPDQTRALVREIRDMGFYQTIGLLHDGLGQIDPGLIGDALPAFYEEMRALCNKSVVHKAGEGWESRMLQGGTAPFRCRAGARYLYVDEFGNVSYCSQRRGDPGKALLEYGRDDLERAYHIKKGCEASCTIACVRRASSLDEWRAQESVAAPPVAAAPAALVG